MIKTTEWTGAASTVEDAIAKGLKKMGLTRDQVEVKVLGEKTSGLFSLFGFRRMEVKLIEKPGARRSSERGERSDRGERPRGGRDEFRNDRGPRDGGGRDGRRSSSDRSGRDRGRDNREPRRDNDRRGTRDESRRGEAPRDNRGDGRRDERNRPPLRGDRPANDRPRDGASRDGGFRNDRGPRQGDGRPSDSFRSEQRPPRDRDERPRDEGFNSGERGSDRPPRDDGRNDARRGGPDRGPRNDRFRDDRPRPAQPPRDDASRPQRAPQEPPSPETLLTQWKSLLGWDDLSWTPKNGETGEIALVLDAAAADKLAAEGADVIDSLQHLLNVVRSKSDRGAPRVFLEVEGQAAMTESRIVEEARNAAAEVQRTGSPFRLAPMDSRDRRLVHQTLAGHPDVETASEGEGQWRKVVVKLKNRE